MLVKIHFRKHNRVATLTNVTSITHENGLVNISYVKDPVQDLGFTTCDMPEAGFEEETIESIDCTLPTDLKET